MACPCRIRWPNASDGAQLALESEMSLVAAIRNDTGLNQD